MEQTPSQKQRGFTSKMSIESPRKSNMSGRLSQSYLSWNGRQPSLENRTSLIYAMDVQSNHSRHSDLFRRLLDSQKGKPFDSFRNSTNPLGSNNESNNEVLKLGTLHNFEGFSYQYNLLKQQKAQVSRINIHNCQCYGNDCDKQKCQCFEHPQQLCLKGVCCVECISLKYQIMKAQSASNFKQGQPNAYSHQNTCTCKNTRCLKSYCSCFRENGYCGASCKCQDCANTIDSLQRQLALQQMEKTMKNQTQIICTCKKTKCNKKYCKCYSSGVKCGKLCSCEGCLNCDQNFYNMGMDVQNQFYYQDNGVEMPNQIEFDPPQLPQY